MTHIARKLQGSRSKSKIRELASAATTSTGSSNRSSPLNKTPAPGWDCGSPGRSSRNTGAPSRYAASALLVRRAERNFPSSCLPLLPPRTRSPESVPWQSRAFAQARGPHKSAFRVQGGPEVFYLNSVNFALGNNFNSPQGRDLVFCGDCTNSANRRRDQFTQRVLGHQPAADTPRRSVATTPPPDLPRDV